MQSPKLLTKLKTLPKGTPPLPKGTPPIDWTPPPKPPQPIIELQLTEAKKRKTPVQIISVPINRNYTSIRLPSEKKTKASPTIGPKPEDIEPPKITIKIPKFIFANDRKELSGKIQMWRVPGFADCGGFGDIGMYVTKIEDNGRTDFKIFIGKTSKNVKCRSLNNEIQQYQNARKNRNLLKFFGAGRIDGSSKKTLFIQPAVIAMDKEIEIRGSKQNSLDIEVALLMMEQISSGIQKIHALGMSHLDLKPANILIVQVHNDVFKLAVCDLGSITSYNGEETHRTPAFGYYGLTDESCDNGAIVLIGYLLTNPLCECLWWSEKGANRGTKGLLKNLEAQWLQKSLSLKPLTALLSECETDRKLGHLQARRMTMPTVVNNCLTAVGGFKRELYQTDFIYPLNSMIQHRRRLCEKAVKEDKNKVNVQIEFLI